jgi:uncharacterized protein YkwD
MKSIVMRNLLAGLLVVGVIFFWPHLVPQASKAVTPAVVKRVEPASPPPGVRHLTEVENLILEYTNQARQARGLAPLHPDDELRQVARDFSDDMLVRRFFDHTTPEGVTFDERLGERYHHWVSILSENIWSGTGYSPKNARKLAKMIVDDWMRSPGHRKNLLNPEFTHLGVGVAVRHHTILATQEFVGRPKTFNWEEFLRPWLQKVHELCGTACPPAEGPGSKS